METWSETTKSVILFVGLLLVFVAVTVIVIGGIELAPKQNGLSQLVIGAPATLELSQFSTDARSYPVNLQAEIEPSMFQGTVEGIDPSKLSVTITTDFGRTLVLFSLDCRTVRGLSEGDRVFLQPDQEGVLTVSPLNPSLFELKQSPKQASHLAWAPGRCQHGTVL
jgi:hypothetical protein